MEEIFVGVATNIFEKLATKAFQEAALAWGLKDEMERLKNSMQFICAFLVDAEKKKAENDSIVVWLRQLKAAFLDAEDVLDEIECEALRNKVVKMHCSGTRKVRRFFSSSNPLVFRIKMAHKIKHVKERIDEITSKRESYGLLEIPLNNMPFIPREVPLRETHSHLDAALVIGRDEEKEELVSFLKSAQTHDDQISVASIVGIGGLGKTTLAKLVYNDNRIVEHFESRIWICVSDTFDVKKLISDILKKMGVQHQEALSLDEIQFLIREKFPKKKHLLVLDDVWNEDRKKWVKLSNALTCGGIGQNDSKIIVTTRSEEVASIMGTAHQHKLEGLSQDDSWKLFVQWAFQEGEEEQQPRLKKIGEEIIKKCKGVPLAVVSLASMLYSKRDVNEWKKVRDNEIWQMDEQKVDILPVLRLSYHYLTFHVKSCFSYCSIFPKDYLFHEYELIYFWMAQGLLQSSNENEDPEHIGKLYVKELISRCFLQIEEQTFGLHILKMHDLVHDLAMSTMQSEAAVMSSSSLATNANKNIRHISISSSDQQISTFNNKMSNNIRTIGFLNNLSSDIVATEPFFKWISNTFKYLRVLDVSFCKLKSLPDCFRKMKQLRFLNLMGNELEKIPNSIWTLQNLLYLNMVGCPLDDLPKDMRNLISLRYLGLSTKASSLSHAGLGCFKSLYFLIIAWCGNLVNLPYDLAQLPGLRKLMIGNCEMLVKFQEEEEKENIEGVQDLRLEHFVVGYCPMLKSLPSWLQRAKNLQYMHIEYCEGLEVLPEWMPNLKSLEGLDIRWCPKLSERCRKECGSDWPKIAHIPKLTILDNSESGSVDLESKSEV